MFDDGEVEWCICLCVHFYAYMTNFRISKRPQNDKANKNTTTTTSITATTTATTITSTKKNVISVQACVAS